MPDRRRSNARASRNFASNRRLSAAESWMPLRSFGVFVSPSPTRGAGDEAIRGILREISNGASNEKDDEKLVTLIKEEIVRTAQSIKTPTGSIEAAARRAQRLVTELTASYTSTIYKSKTTEAARSNFARFRNTVQKIVDFIKNGQFVV